GEYPNDPKTRDDCFKSGIIWKLLMPKTIYTTPVPSMKFLVARETEDLAQTPEATGNVEAMHKLSMRHYCNEVFTKLHGKYFSTVKMLQRKAGFTQKEAEDALFGPTKDFFQWLLPINPQLTTCQDYAKYDRAPTRIAGGFQSVE